MTTPEDDTGVLAGPEPAPSAPEVLLLSLIFPPDAVSTSQLLGEIAEDLTAAGMSVSVITAQPHYNTDEIAVAAQPIRWRWHRLTGQSWFHEIPVTHIRMPSKAASPIQRILQWLWFHLASVPLMYSRRHECQVVVAVSPPPSIALAARAGGLFRRRQVVLALWELYPEILVRLDQVEAGSVLHRLLVRLERWTYRASDAVLVLHDGMAAAVCDTEPRVATRVSVVPTFADTQFLRPGDRNTPLRRELGLADRFVVGYAGNLGVSQDLFPLLQAASELSDEHFAFVFVGDGSERPSLEAEARRLGLSNVWFTGQLPYSRVPEITDTFDVGVVALAPSVGAEALPSKTYRLMASGCALLALVSDESPVARLVRDHSCGIVTPPDDAPALVDAIRRLASDPQSLDRFRQRARAAAVESFSRTAVAQQYVDVVRRVLSESRSGSGVPA